MGISFGGSCRFYGRINAIRPKRYEAMFIISIVPRLPPAVDGLGDYALSLARHLYNDFDIKTHFVVCDPIWVEKSEVEGFSISCLTNRSPSALLSSLAVANPTIIVLLHYVGYGYARRGAPSWLIDGLERWHRSNGAARILTMFHELYAKGPVWTSSFWLSPLQKHLAARLAWLRSEEH